MWKYIQKGDYGSIGRICLVQDGVAINVSSYTTIKFLFEKPSGETIERTGAFDTDGVNGVVKYIFAVGDLDEIGPWLVQVTISKTGHSISSEQLKFRVNEIIIITP